MSSEDIKSSPADSLALTDTEADAFVEIKGRVGSKTIIRKQLSSIDGFSEATLEKLKGLALRLPAVAFDAFLDGRTIELMLNPDGKVWLERMGEDMVHICNMPEAEAENFIRHVAGFQKKVVTAEAPTLDAVLPLDESRFAGQLPPAVARPTFCIRKRAIRVFTLDEYVASGVMTDRQCVLIRQAVIDRKNILIIGGTGTGKTTFGNAVLNEITVTEPNARQIIIEDTAELNCTAANKVNYQVTPFVTMTDLLKVALRMRPDRIIVGEVRGPEAFDLIQAWNTGHPGGIATLHANDCLSGLRRLKSLISQHPFAPRDIEPDIALAVNVMVNIIKAGKERRIREIVVVRDYDPKHLENNGYRLEAQ